MDIKSEFLRLSKNDIVHGLIVAIISAALTALIQSVQTGNFNWQAILSVAAVAGLSFLSKQFLSDSNGKFLGGI